MKVLFISFKRYAGILDGGGMANQRNVAMAQQMYGEDNVDVFYVHDEGKRRSLGNYLQTLIHMPRGYYNGFTPKMLRSIADRAHEYDCIFINTSLFGIIAKHLKEIGYKGKVIVHFHNVESVYYEHRLPKRMPFRQILIRCAALNDRYACQYADRIVVLNQRDAQMIAKEYGRTPDAIANIALKDKFTGADEAVMTNRKPLCLFMGSSFAANNEGVLWFVQHVLPHVDIDFKVVGRGMAKLQATHKCLQNVDVVSDVPDLAPYFAEADFMVLPIFSGSGMKVKTCECLMYGKNILGTDETFEGYDIDDAQVGGRCNTAQEYIDALKHYAAHPIPRFNQYARTLYLEQYSEEKSVEVFRQLFEG